MNITRILCIIDDLGPGGAERQMTGLAIMLKECGYDVLVRYHEPKHFFTDQIKSAGIDVVCMGAQKSRSSKVLLYRKEIKKIKPDLVISYLQPSNILTSLIRLSGLKYKVIVSERNTNTQKGLRDYLRFNLYRIADWVVPNSYSQASFIKKEFSFLIPKIRTIVNFVDTDSFKPTEKTRDINILVVATIWPPKNTLGFINALYLLKKKGIKCHVRWYGKVPDQLEYINKCEQLINELEVSDYIELLDKTQKIAEKYNNADYFCLPSFHEGTPNVICEAMASGLPIVCSNVCDNSRYVENGVNGFLFDPKSPEDMANVIAKILTISDSKYYSFKIESRKKAVTNLSKNTFIKEYLQLIHQIQTI